MGVPPKKFNFFFPEIFCQHKDRKRQEFSATFVKPLGRDRHRKKVRVKLTLPPCVIGLMSPPLNHVLSLHKSLKSCMINLRHNNDNISINVSVEIKKNII